MEERRHAVTHMSNDVASNLYPRRQDSIISKYLDKSRSSEPSNDFRRSSLQEINQSSEMGHKFKLPPIAASPQKRQSYDGGFHMRTDI